MKTVSIFLMMIFFQLAGGIAAGQEAKSPIHNAKRIANIVYLEPNTSLEQCAYILPSQNARIMKLDGDETKYEDEKLIIIPQGTYLFSIFTWASVNLNVLLEAGKYYMINSVLTEKVLKRSTVSVTMDEVTGETILEKAREEIAYATEYMKWTQKNIDKIGGSYQTNDGELQISFTANQFEIVKKRTRTTYKGTFCFDAETMIMRIESQNDKTFTIERTKGYLHYKLEDNLLDVIDSSGFFERRNSIKGQYFKNN